MADGSDNIILRSLRRIDAKVDRLAEGSYDIKVRLTGIGKVLVGAQWRIDRLEHRVDRIERRLDLVDQPH